MFALVAGAGKYQRTLLRNHTDRRPIYRRKSILRPHRHCGTQSAGETSAITADLGTHPDRIDDDDHILMAGKKEMARHCCCSVCIVGDDRFHARRPLYRHVAWQCGRADT